MKPTGEPERWLDRKENVDKVYWSVWVMCGLLLVAELFLQEKYTYFDFENWFGFHGLYGFVACVALVIAAKGLRVLLIRPEDYYERD